MDRKKPLFRLLLFALLISLFYPDNRSRAEHTPFFISGTYGISRLDTDGFDSPESWGALFGVESKYLTFGVGYLHLGEFDSERAQDTRLEVEGVILSLIKGFQLYKDFYFDLKGGVYRWSADAAFLGMHVGKDEGTDVWGGGAVRYQFTPSYAMFLGAEKFWDVSGSDVARFSLGAIFTY